MLIGLAPAAHGGNRTGRVFTGDESARFLMHALHKAGLANQPTSVSKDDGLRLDGCYIAAAARCVPPDNRPTIEEFRNCRQYLDREFELLTRVHAVVALGQLAFKAYLDYVKSRGVNPKGATFAHGACVRIPGLPTLYGSYHPSPRNTYTGKLTESMLLDVLERAKSQRPAMHV
jgi:uracil-DNA glycosylase family 4